jgi:hypothetical protein
LEAHCYHLGKDYIAWQAYKDTEIRGDRHAYYCSFIEHAIRQIGDEYKYLYQNFELRTLRITDKIPSEAELPGVAGFFQLYVTDPYHEEKLRKQVNNEFNFKKVVCKEASIRKLMKERESMDFKKYICWYVILENTTTSGTKTTTKKVATFLNYADAGDAVDHETLWNCIYRCAYKQISTSYLNKRALKHIHKLH